MRKSQNFGVINSLMFSVSVGKLHNCLFIFFYCSENYLHGTYEPQSRYTEKITD